MKVIGYESLRTAHDWGRPIGDANGVLRSGVTPVPILLVHTDEGVTGVGLGAHDDIDRVFRVVEGEDPRGVTALYDRMLDAVFKTGHHGATFGAIGALDMALWDLKAKLAGEPLWRLLGGRDRFVPGYASGLCMGLDDEAFAQTYAQFAARGFRAAKIKGGLDVERDISRLRLVADVMGGGAVRGGVPGSGAAGRDVGSDPSRSVALMLDANECWSAAQAVRHVARLEAAVDLAWIEEPVRRLDADGLAHVRSKVRAAVATGENLTGLELFRPLLQRQAVDVVQTGSVWGVTHFLRVSALAHAFGLPVSPVAYDANPLAHAAAAVPNNLGLEIQDLRHPTGLLVDHEIADGGVVLGDAPGLGIEVDRAVVAAAEEAAPWGILAGPHVRPARAGLRLLPPGPGRVVTSEPMRRVRRVSVVDEIVEQFTQGIISGQWPPGSTLPSLRTFATETGVSMLTVREALRVLQARGLVETRHGVGTFVRSPEDRDAVPWMLGREDADEYFELVEAREVIETAVLQLAAERRTPEQLARLRKIVVDMEAARTDVSAFLDADVGFHDAMAEAAHNRILLRAMRAIRGPLRRLIANRTVHHLETIGHLDAPISDHRDLVDAVEAGEVDKHLDSLGNIMTRARDYLTSLRDDPS